MRTFKLLVLAPFAIVAACGGDKPTPPVTPPTTMETPDAGMPSDMPASSGTSAMPASSASAMPASSASAMPASSAAMAAPDAGPADAGKAGAKKDEKKPAAPKK